MKSIKHIIFLEHISVFLINMHTMPGSRDIMQLSVSRILSYNGAGAFREVSIIHLN